MIMENLKYLTKHEIKTLFKKSAFGKDVFNVLRIA
jgi:hypothetical protein